MLQKKTFNNDIAILKFIFTLVIVWHHSDIVVPHHPYLFFKGNLGVEFFFLISGYFMASSIVRNLAKGIEQNAFEFTLHKIKLIFPQLLSAFLIAFVLYNFVITNVPLRDICTLGIFSIGELSFIDIMGLKMSKHFFNGPAWYVNAMMLAIFILYPLAKKNIKKFGNYWGVVIPLFLYAYLITMRQKTLGGHVFQWANFTTASMIRAIAGISLGISLYVASEAIKNGRYKITKVGNTLLRILSLAILILLFMFMTTHYFAKFKVVTDLNFVAYSFIFLLIIFITESKWSFVESKTIKFLSTISLPIYLNHYVCLYFVKTYFSHVSSDKRIGLVILFTLIASAITLLLAKLFSKSFAKLHKLCFKEKSTE